MTTTPKKFGFIRTTLALWAADLGAFVRGGVVSDSPNGGNAWGVNIPGTGWIYAAMRGASEVFSSVDAQTLKTDGSTRIDANGDFTGRNQSLTGWLTLNGVTRPAWGGSWVATMLGGTSALSNFNASGGSWSVLSNNFFFDGTNDRAIESSASTRYPVYLALNGNGGLSLVASQTLPTAGDVIPDLVLRWSVNRFGGIGLFGVTPPTSRPTVNAACTDLATCIALTNQLRTHLIACGLVQ